MKTLNYKLYCLHTALKYRMNAMVKLINYYDLNLKLADIEKGLTNYYRKSEVIFEKPKNIGDII